MHYVSFLWGDNGSFVVTLWKRLIDCGALSLELLGFRGSYTFGDKFSIWLVEWLGKHSSHIWNLVLLCLMWCIWRERNRRTFEDLDRSDDQLLALFFGSLFDWSRA